MCDVCGLCPYYVGLCRRGAGGAAAARAVDEQRTGTGSEKEWRYLYHGHISINLPRHKREWASAVVVIGSGAVVGLEESDGLGESSEMHPQGGGRVAGRERERSQAERGKRREDPGEGREDAAKWERREK
jgi:hypothetical protein